MSETFDDNSSISHHRIAGKIGAGGMGEVYLANDTKLDRKVALKILPSEFAEDADRMSRFVREAKSASALNHPNIITIYEIGESGGTHFIATEFIEGGTLRKRLKGEHFSLKTVLDIATQIASALETAHSAGIVHRDIKPDNIMIRSDGLAKILDFGIAKLSEPTAIAGGLNLSEEDSTAIKPNSTSPGTVIGTANYMSPEQAKGKEIDARSDIFSFGIVFYEMLSGRRAFAGETALESISSILKDEPTPLHQILPDIPNEVERIAGKALRKDREERYQTAKDLLIDLKEAKHDLEFQNKLERSIVPNKDADKTQILKATTSDETNQTTTNQTLARNPKSKYLAAGLLALILAVGGFFGYKYFAPTNKQINSVAVLPFENKSSDADTDYLSDGLAESLIYRLSQIPDLKVSPTSSVFRYKGRETDAKKVAGELGVDAVMMGRMVKRGDSLTISVELVDVRNNKTLWGEQYERKMSELLQTQREIAAEITNKLKLKLSGEGEQRLAKRYTDSNEAYQLYLKGRFHLNKRTTESLKQAVEFYRGAIEKDPNFALAYSGLAETYAIFPIWSVGLPKDSMPQAKAAAWRALEIDETLAEAHAALGLYLHYFEFDRSGGEKEMRRAIELNPNYATAHEWLGVDILTALKRFDEAVTEVRRAEELDPLSSVTRTNVGYTLVFARRYDEAIAQLKRVLSLDPNYAYALYTLGYAFDGKGMYAEAIVEYRKSLSLNDDPFAKALLARSLVKSGKRGEALKLVEQLKLDSAKRYVSHYCLAIAYTALGEKEEALILLEKDIAERSSFVSYSAGEPALDDLRGDPRFKDLLKRMNLPE